MSNKEILEKAIRKAIDGGWKPFGLKEVHQIDIGEAFSEYDYGQLIRLNGASGVVRSIFDVIFNHDFAKALWGDSLLHDVIARDYSRSDMMYWTLDPMYMPPNNWQFHLQQMVIADDPLQYLADNLGE